MNTCLGKHSFLPQAWSGCSTREFSWSLRAVEHIAQRKGAERQHLIEMKQKAKETIRRMCQQERDRQDGESQITAEMSKGGRNCLRPLTGVLSGAYRLFRWRQDSCCSSCWPSVGAHHVASEALSFFLFSFCGHVTLLSRLMTDFSPFPRCGVVEHGWLK